MLFLIVGRTKTGYGELFFSFYFPEVLLYHICWSRIFTFKGWKKIKVVNEINYIIANLF